MPRVHHIKKARKDNPVCKKGESYYSWEFRYGGKRYSLTYPKPSQLTQSAFLSQARALIESDVPNFETVDDFDGWRDEKVSELEELRDMSQESLDNMPYDLQESSSSGQLLQERIDEVENMISEVESVEVEEIEEPEETDFESDDEYEEAKSTYEDEKVEAFERAIEEVTEGLSYEGG